MCNCIVLYINTLFVRRLPEDRIDDVIDIADEEPSNKRPRIVDDSEVAEKISVSSESSVEISGESDDEVQEVTSVNVENNDDEDVGEQQDVNDAGGEQISEAQSNVEEDGRNQVVVAPVNAEVSGEKSIETDLEVKSQEITNNQVNVYSDESAAITVENRNESEDTPIQETDNPDNIHEVETQMVLNTSSGSVEESHSPRSMEVEVGFDFPPRGETRIPILQKTDDDNLPSTNDTDDVAITCGQIVKGSQELDNENNKEVENKENEVPKVNGDSNLDKIDGNIAKVAEIVIDKTSVKDVSVEDMLADFVDEINEENKTEV